MGIKFQVNTRVEIFIGYFTILLNRLEIMVTPTDDIYLRLEFLRCDELRIGIGPRKADIYPVHAHSQRIGCTRSFRISMVGCQFDTVRLHDPSIIAETICPQLHLNARPVPKISYLRVGLVMLVANLSTILHKPSFLLEVWDAGRGSTICKGLPPKQVYYQHAHHDN